jgi:hypothetical protein
MHQVPIIAIRDLPHRAICHNTTPSKPKALAVMISPSQVNVRQPNQRSSHSACLDALHVQQSIHLSHRKSTSFVLPCQACAAE